MRWEWNQVEWEIAKMRALLFELKPTATHSSIFMVKFYPMKSFVCTIYKW